MTAANLFALNIAIAAALWAGGAAAQDLRYSDADSQYCIDTAGTYAEMEACVGASAAACMSATDLGGTTIGMVDCLGHELTFWDRRLNSAYKALRAREQREDEQGYTPEGAPKQAIALRDMQRAWIAFRDRTCDFERAQWGGGTGGGPAYVGCQMRMTGTQALYLQQMLESY